MVFPPGHAQQVAKLREPSGGRQRRRVLLATCAVAVACAIGLTAWSLTKSSPRLAPGCIAFSFMTPVGGSSDSACGATARELCLAPVPKLVKDGDYYAEMRRACRRAGLPT